MNQPGEDAPQARADLWAALERDRFAAHNGVELLEVRPGYARTQVTIGPDHYNSVDLVHGGLLFTLAAVALFAACNAAGRVAVGINLNLSCLQPAREGRLVAEAEEVSRSRRLVTCQVRITDDQARLVATLQGTAFLKEEAFPGGSA